MTNEFLYKDYEAVIGLETHFELNTVSKVFCSCKTVFGAMPNTQVCPVCMGFPGTLPCLNKTVVEYAVKAGLALNCDIAEHSSFDRKSYFYPDSPKAFQITQHQNPICKNGYILIDSMGEKKKIRLCQIHIEEDAGKLIHDKNHGTLIDFNRCGIPLIEIVSAPDLSSAEQAVSYLKKLRSIILYTGISDCMMNQGSMRADVNISVRRQGSLQTNNRVEIKNINSFSFVKKAIEYEFVRQVDLLCENRQIESETRRFDEHDGKTHSMRKKQDFSDYFYFPDPDLPCIEITKKQIEQIKASMPVMPDKKAQHLMKTYMLTEYQSNLITCERLLCEYFERAADKTPFAQILCSLILSEIMRLCSDFDNILLSSDLIAEIATLCGNQTISFSAAKKIVCALWDNKAQTTAYSYAKNNNLLQINSRDTLKDILSQVIEQNPKFMHDIKNGKTAALKALAGSVMKATGGAANPNILNSLIQELVNN